ncbi:glycoside hydrolase family 19 protein [Massilia sp. P8910]|uniref:glycoside hydrolase family 19 protein n=1 Tax=Massilia antarctica TaxID=2765360 RepID=UPI001E42E176|nr:glycoside hydrolase family 19 protein [Massilia antarctica]MCE3608085.1 glycoside hydrolase family 19 protein [Massilia antarctica]
MPSFMDFLGSFFSKTPVPAKAPAVPPVGPTPAPVALPAAHAPKPDPMVFQWPAKQGVGITVDHLVRMGASPANAAKYCKAFNDVCERFGINTRARICAFIAQTFHESSCLRVVRENLNYTAKNCMDFWPKSFPTDASTVGYTMNPQALANKMYGGKNGNTQPGDGWRYSGRGVIQITFRGNYEPCGVALGLDLVNHPELLELPEHAVASAGWFWTDNKLNAVADGDNEAAVIRATEIINGRHNGLDNRMALWRKAKVVFASFK